LKKSENEEKTEFAYDLEFSNPVLNQVFGGEKLK
jgi:hypothetical protein